MFVDRVLSLKALGAIISFSRVFGLRFVIILREKSGKEHIMQHVDVSFNDTSVTVVWYGKNWPKLAMLSTLDLCGMTPVFADRHKTFDPYG